MGARDAVAYPKVVITPRASPLNVGKTRPVNVHTAPIIAAPINPAWKVQYALRTGLFVARIIISVIPIMNAQKIPTRL
ncbi:MAG: hypothetical protein A4E59_01414 [Syntrophorhabdus sp. PtaB.Bin027]|nr:MAG: hypothetical protein A4E59_01414 [Syntrophorhabdus sp. PtaB.Bin027]